MLIGLVGFVGSGKDTVGNILVDMGFIRDSYAAPLKDAVSVIFGWDRQRLEGAVGVDRVWRETPDPYWSEKFGRPFSPREALQLMGTEAGRNIFHKDLWMASLENRLQKNKDYVITDVRFPNEIEQINRLGGHVVRVRRGQEPLWFDYAAQWNLNVPEGENFQVMKNFPGIHHSEFAWIGNPLIHSTIDNNGTLEDLDININVLVVSLLPVLD